LHGFLDLFPGPHRLSGHAELAIHGEGNPWNAPAQELQAAGTDVSFRIGELELGGRFDLQRPERSRWLAAFLPPEWLCITRPEPPAGAPEVCYGDEVRYLGGASASLHFQRVVLTAGASASTSDRAQSRQLGGFVGSRLRVAQELRIDTSLMLSTGSLLDTYAASLGVGTGLAGELVDVALRYRPAWNQYRADPSGFLEHAFGARIALASQGELGLTLDADVITGRDVDVLLLQTLLTWRPLGG
jgi:hypothetical protein